MIWNIFFFTIRLLLELFLYIFTLVTFSIPPEFQDNVNLLVSKINYFGGVVPIDTVIQVTSLLLTFFTVYYIIKIIRWAYAHIPFVGRNVKNPTVSSRPGKN